MSPPTRWLEVRAWTSGEPDDGRLAEALLELGGRAVHEVDGALVTHLDPEGLAFDPEDRARLASRLCALTGLGEVHVSTAWQEQEDWAEVWKRGLEPRRVGRRFVVTPSWHHPEVGPGDLVVVLDPGMAFGNAEHGTTRGCLRLLEHAVRPGERVMDVGTGSGVLAIAAARLGAASVDALEADPWAVAPARENVGANGVADRVRVREATADTDTLAAMGPHDGVVANIEAGVLTSLLPGFAASVRPGGWLVLSGVLGSQLEALTDAAREHGFDSLAVDIDGDWRSALLRRRAGTTPIHPTPRSGDRLQA